jgi:deoxyadenosine/deoxycytidine kinase
LAERLAHQTDARLIRHQPDTENLVKLYADSSGSAWNTELEFLNERIDRLASGLAGRSDRNRLVVSDFWIDQSLAFASVWLAADEYARLRERWTERCSQLARPKFAVALDAPSDRLRERIRRRGLCPEQSLSDQVLERIRQAILALATSPGHGPVLRLKSDEPGRLVDEVVAAIESSKPDTLL